MRIKLTLLFLSVSILACSLPTATVSKTPDTVTPKPVSIDTGKAKTATVTAYDALHVRNEPMGVVIGYLYHADPVTLTGTCSTDPAGWAEIAWHGGTAWVASRYLSDNPCKEGE
jgi:hypothetical protein